MAGCCAVRVEGKNGLDQLKLDLTTEETASAELTNVVAVRNSAQAELTELFKQLFDGPTPDVPGEDEKEDALKKIEHDFNVRQFQFSNEKQAAEFLRDVGRMMNQTLDVPRRSIAL